MIKQYILDLKGEFRAYDRKKLSQDLLAGLTVAAVALPLALAFGVSSGADAGAGLITAILSGLIIGALSGASFQISGPTGAMTAILIGLVHKYGMEGVFLSTLLAGIFLVLAAFLKFGKLVALIPGPVITGFTSGIAVIIALGQIDSFLGIQSGESELFHKLSVYFSGRIAPDKYAVAIGLLVILVMFIWPKKWNAKIPASLGGIMIALMLTVFFKLPLQCVGDIPQTLLPQNRLKLGDLSSVQISAFMMPALSIAALGMIESLLCGASAGRMKGEKMNGDRELFAQGIGNMILPFFGGVPATAAIARTSVAIKSGSQTRLTSIFHAVGLLISMFLLGAVMSKIPLAALSGVLIVTAWRMNEWESIHFIFNKKLKTAIAQFLITMLATILLDLTLAIIIGFIFSVLFFMVRISDIQIDSKDVDVNQLEVYNSSDEENKVTKVVYLTGPVFFTTAEKISQEIIRLDQIECVIFSMRGVPLIDTTGIQVLSEICDTLKRQGTEVLFASVQPKVKDMMERSGFISNWGKEKFFWSAKQAILAREAPLEIINH